MQIQIQITVRCLVLLDFAEDTDEILEIFTKIFISCHEAAYLRILLKTFLWNTLLIAKKVLYIECATTIKIYKSILSQGIVTTDITNMIFFAAKSVNHAKFVLIFTLFKVVLESLFLLVVYLSPGLWLFLVSPTS